MKNQKHLLEKYYKGETTLEEENYLKTTLTSKEIEKDDPYTILMFKAFSEEKNEPAPSSLKTLSFLSQKSTKFTKLYFYRKKWLQIAAATAACLAIIFTFLYYNNNPQYEAYVIINGVRINDEKLALQYIKECYEEEERINKLALTRLYEMERIENKLNEIKNQINNTINNFN